MPSSHKFKQIPGVLNTCLWKYPKDQTQSIEFTGHSDMMIMFWGLFYCILLCLSPSLEQLTHKDSSSSNKIRDKSLTELNSSDEHILLCREHHSPTSLCPLPCFHCIMRVSLHLACQHLFFIDSRASSESALNQKGWENKNTERILYCFTGFHHVNTYVYVFVCPLIYCFIVHGFDLALTDFSLHLPSELY